jgi:hypothetical protein
MNRVLKILVLLPAILFLVTGLRWLVAPAGVAPFFLTLASCMLIALISGRRSWYYPAIMLLSITAVGRILAWLVHDATLALDLIAPEVIVSIILLVASRRLPEEA